MLEPTAIDILNKYFVFDRVFNLIEYANNMDDLYTELNLLKRDSFESNYRFIFLHYDTEYYIRNIDPGLTMSNLQTILHELDIPNYFCLILTQQNIQHFIDELGKEKTNDPTSIASIQNCLHQPLYCDADANLELNVGAITKHYISLNGARRFHRRILVSILKDRLLVDKGVVSYGAVKYGDPPPTS